MQNTKFVHRLALCVTVCAAVMTTACASASRSPAQQASLDDPRMVCAKVQLFKLGYEADASVRKPGRLIATKTFSTARNHRAAILAEVDSTDKTFDMWARVLPRDGDITVAEIRQQPPLSMLADAMEVENTCADAKR